jgi:type I restriction enzyme S subunit
MTGEWTRMPLGEFVTLQRGHDLPDDTRRPGHVPILGSFGITGWHDIAKAPGPGVTVGRSGASFGVVSYSPTNYWPLNTALYVIDFHGNDERFAYYLLKQFDFKGYNSGSAQPSLNRNFVHPVPVDVPPLSEQRSIAHILGTLDDKIEVNQRISETLEAIARALFKSWFVHFDVVRAKSEGRDPGLPYPLADLFPDSFEHSELGEIPKGFEVGPLGQFFEIGLGGAWGDEEQSPRASVGVRCLRGIDCHDLAEGRIPNVPVRWLSVKQAEDRKLAEGAILVEGSGSFCGRSLIWRRSYEDLIGGPASYSNFCKRLDPRCSAAKALVCWMHLRQAYREGLLQSFRIGTAFPNFDIEGALSNLMVVVPPEPLAVAFAKMVVLTQRLDLMAQSRTLANVRDTLLPKLISGQLRAPGPERNAGAL